MKNQNQINAMFSNVEGEARPKRKVNFFNKLVAKAKEQGISEEKIKDVKDKIKSGELDLVGVKKILGKETNTTAPTSGTDTPPVDMGDTKILGLKPLQLGVVAIVVLGIATVVYIKMK